MPEQPARRKRRGRNRSYLGTVERALRDNPRLSALHCKAVTARDALSRASEALASAAADYAAALAAPRPPEGPFREAGRRLREICLNEHDRAAEFVAAASQLNQALVRACARKRSASSRLEPRLRAPIVLPSPSAGELRLRFPLLGDFVRRGRGPDPLGDEYLYRMWPRRVAGELGDGAGEAALFSRAAHVRLYLGLDQPSRNRDADNYLSVEVVLGSLIRAGVLPCDWLGSVSCWPGGATGVLPGDGAIAVQTTPPVILPLPEISALRWSEVEGFNEPLAGLVRPVALAPEQGRLVVRFPPIIPRAPLMRDWCRFAYRHEGLARLWAESLKGGRGSKRRLRGGQPWPDLPIPCAEVAVFLPAADWRQGALTVLRAKLVLNALAWSGLLSGDSFARARLQLHFRSDLDRVLAVLMPASNADCGAKRAAL